MTYSRNQSTKNKMMNVDNKSSVERNKCKYSNGNHSQHSQTSCNKVVYNLTRSANPQNSDTIHGDILFSRMSLKMLFSIVTLIFLGSLPEIRAQNTNIQIRQGPIQGIVQDVGNRKIYSYLGIPYAKPPTGNLRFKPPESHGGWTSNFFADKFGPACPQPFLLGHDLSEDCLTLNVWIPEIPRGLRKFPVVVIFEGELFITSAPKRFPAQDLSANDVVVVSVGYRTNAFGFLSYEDDVLPGNLGLRDQDLALRWVNENIDFFGGDANRVTLLGHSAGAASVGFHMSVQQRQGMFHRAIMLSGSSLAPWALSQHPRRAAVRFQELLNCNLGSRPSSIDILRCLRNKDSTTITKIVEKMIEEGNPDNFFAPVVDDFLLSLPKMVPRSPQAAIRSHDVKSIPTILGMNEHDGTVMLYIKREINYMSYDDLTRYGREILVPLVTSMSGMRDGSSPARRVVEYAYLNKANPSDKDDLVSETVNMFSDAFFKAPVLEHAEMLADIGRDAYLLINTFPGPDFYHSPSNITGAMHASEMLYLLGPASYRQNMQHNLNFQEERLGGTMKSIVYTFANRGEPSLGSFSPRWEKYSRQTGWNARLESSQIRQNGFERHLLDLWTGLLPSLNVIDPLNPTCETITAERNASVAYQNAVWVLVVLIVVLLLVIIGYIIKGRRSQKHEARAFQDQ